MTDASTEIVVHNRVDRVVLGIVRARGIVTGYQDDMFDDSLSDLISERADGVTGELENVRAESRNMLRNRTYKPTGRGKPASEYLLRAASQPDSFPRVNWPVDICNFISLKYILPISIWDLDAASAEVFVFRLGLPGEDYVFNTAGQEIGLCDLVVGCAVRGADYENGIPIVNPIKDSMATKTSPSTTDVAASIYAPASLDESVVRNACDEFAEWLGRSDDDAVTAVTVVSPGERRSC